MCMHMVQYKQRQKCVSLFCLYHVYIVNEMHAYIAGQNFFTLQLHIRKTERLQ